MYVLFWVWEKLKIFDAKDKSWLSLAFFWHSSSPVFNFTLLSPQCNRELQICELLKGERQHWCQHQPLLVAIGLIWSALSSLNSWHPEKEDVGKIHLKQENIAAKRRSVVLQSSISSFSQMEKISSMLNVTMEFSLLNFPRFHWNLKAILKERHTARSSCERIMKRIYAIPKDLNDFHNYYWYLNYMTRIEVVCRDWFLIFLVVSVLTSTISNMNTYTFTVWVKSHHQNYWTFT